MKRKMMLILVLIIFLILGVYLADSLFSDNVTGFITKEASEREIVSENSEESGNLITGGVVAIDGTTNLDEGNLNSVATEPVQENKKVVYGETGSRKRFNVSVEVVG